MHRSGAAGREVPVMSGNPVKWYMRPNSYDDVVISSNVRLARNLADFDYRDKISNDDAATLVERVRALTQELAGRECTEYYSCNVNKLPEAEKASLVELHAITPELAEKKQPTGLIISEDESVSIMINEEDHIRISVNVAGNDIRSAYKTADRIDDYIDGELQYAFSDRYGYLTTCMSDVGTGLKTGYVLSLPALTMSGKLGAIRDELGKFGAVMRDIYSDNGKNPAFMYEVYNRKTLGMSEQDIIENLEQIVNQIVTLERKRRGAWAQNEHDELEDKIFRSYGVLRHTKLITCKDALMLLAQLKLGLDTGLINLNGTGADLSRLMIEIQPAALCKFFRCGNDERELNKARARLLNERIPSLIR